ncbi:HtaA domain-containing protein [Rhodococcus ruber]|uniref:HtaA domain-containing protein n=1 Tax=Rhodococcus ruber TaxID=1830 RepID=UPI00315D3FC9
MKRSFIRYIASLPDTAYSVVDGAYLEETSFFTFPVDPEAADTPSVVRFRGALRIRAHGGMLDVLIADPWVEHLPSGSILSVVDPAGWPRRDHRIVFADLAVDGPRIAGARGAQFTATLTESGISVFGGQYASGTELDPVALS